MFVLVACEESQRVCISFRKKGHIAFSCDLQDCSGGHPEWHIKCNVLDILNPTKIFDNCGNFYPRIRFYTSSGTFITIPKWDLIIAFPPCTYFSRVIFFNYYRNGVFNSKRFNDSKPFIDLFYSIFNADCPKICIENPLPISIFKNILPPYSMKLQPYEFGEPFSKLTCLWLKGLPYLLPTGLCPYYTSYVKINGNLINGKFNLKEQSKFRSKTFYGVAQAMAEQWG